MACLLFKNEFRGQNRIDPVVEEFDSYKLVKVSIMEQQNMNKIFGKNKSQLHDLKK